MFPSARFLRRSIGIGLAFIWLLSSVTALARPTGAGSGFPVAIGNGPSSSGGDQGIRLVPDDMGGAIVVWSNKKSVFAQRVTQEGGIATGWPANGVLLCTSSSDEEFPDAITDGANGAIVAWQDGRRRGRALYTQRILADGVRAWADTGVAISDVLVLDEFNMCADGSGGAFLTWRAVDAQPPRIAMSHIDGNGSLLPGWQPRGTLLFPQAHQPVTPHVTSDGSGGVFLTWADLRNSPSQDIYASRLNSDGSLALGWNVGGNLVCMAPESRSNQVAISDGAGGVLIAWADARSVIYPDLYAQHVTSAGALAPGWPLEGIAVSKAPYSQGELATPRPAQQSLVTDDFGGLICGWRETRVGGADIWANRITPIGSVAPGWMVDGIPACGVYLKQENPMLARDGNGGAFVAWTDFRNGTDRDMYLSHLTASGALAVDWPQGGTSICIAPGEQERGAICEDGDGGVFVAWNDYRRASQTDSDIYATHVSGDGAVPSLASMIEASAGAGEVRVRWQINSTSMGVLRVERRTTSDGWASLAETSADGSGRLAYDDRDVSPGARYGYRLTWESPSGRQAAGEGWVDVPLVSRLALGGVRPNPATGPVTIAFSLASRGPAQLECIDVSGRLALRREVGDMGPGEHLLRIADSDRLPPGIYFVRLSQEGTSVTTRAAIVR